MTSVLIPRFTIQMAVQAVEVFCKKYGAKFDTPTIVTLAIALREGSEFEWTPSEKEFRRIMFTKPGARVDKRCIAVVFHYCGVDQEKTAELNELINRFTENALVG